MGGDLKQQGQEKEVDFRVKAILGSSGLETTSAFPFLCPPGRCPLQTVCKPGVVLRARWSVLEINLHGTWIHNSVFMNFYPKEQINPPMENYSSSFTHKMNFSFALQFNRIAFEES